MKKILFASTVILSVLSCRENKPQNKPIIENAVDNAESSISKVDKYSRGGNLVVNIYDELLKKDKTLQDLDERILDIYSKTDKVINEYSDIIYKSENYYNDATALAKSVTDSIAKKQIENEIKASSEKYNTKTQIIRDLVSKIKANNIILHDQYVLFKIRKTLPEIEKYQNAHPLKTDNLDQFVNKQNKLLEELKKLK
ncbi:hypothetical protein [Chryseobacterium sp. c4a]|uniref:hypothetical protein n=1 Tax=Chryseobacterium sp. c4a TaxID=1573582 RepID=UPI00135CB7A1|nr:hypothetical protein [Chryseobacterium sp. c4a]